MGNPPADITIRALEPEDLPAYERVHSHPGVLLNTMQPPFLALPEYHAKIGNTPDERNLVALLGDDALGFGDLSLSGGRRAHAAVISLVVHPDRQCQGVRTALLKALLDLGERWYGIRRFELKVYTDDERGMALYERFGFEIEATHRQFAQRDGIYADVHSMARLVT